VVCWGLVPARAAVLPPLAAAPVEIEGLTDVVEIAVASDHDCARTRGGAVWCWGANRNGQLGDGTTTDRIAPVEVTGLR
jgi:alpha-tubulin suppressor-like RCC1 family protein